MTLSNTLSYLWMKRNYLYAGDPGIEDDYSELDELYFKY